MASALRIAAAGSIDSGGIVGSARPPLALDAAPSTGAWWRRAFDAPFADFRKLDVFSKAVCVAVEAAGIPAPADREAVLLLGASRYGCLAADHRFALGLEPDAPFEPKVFPFTLPSTCLGVVAIRHRLTGPTVSLSSETPAAAAVAEATSALRTGEASSALLCLGDWVPPDTAAAVGIDAATHVVAVWLMAGPTRDRDLGTVEVLAGATPLLSIKQALHTAHG